MRKISLHYFNTFTKFLQFVCSLSCHDLCVVLFFPNFSDFLMRFVFLLTNSSLCWSFLNYFNCLLKLSFTLSLVFSWFQPWTHNVPAAFNSTVPTTFHYDLTSTSHSALASSLLSAAALRHLVTYRKASGFNLTEEATRWIHKVPLPPFSPRRLLKSATLTPRGDKAGWETAEWCNADGRSHSLSEQSVNPALAVQHQHRWIYSDEWTRAEWGVGGSGGVRWDTAHTGTELWPPQ